MGRGNRRCRGFRVPPDFGKLVSDGPRLDHHHDRIRRHHARSAGTGASKRCPRSAHHNRHRSRESFRRRFSDVVCRGGRAGVGL